MHGAAYAALTVGGTPGLYTINLTTGAATLVGNFGGGATISSMALGLASTGSNASCSFTVTVNDTQPPVLAACPGRVASLRCELRHRNAGI